MKRLQDSFMAAKASAMTAYTGEGTSHFALCHMQQAISAPCE